MKGKSFELFPSEICLVAFRPVSCVGKMENVPLLCLASWDVIKQSSSTCDGFLCLDAVETINNVDIGQRGDASLPAHKLSIERRLNREESKFSKENLRSIGKMLGTLKVLS